MTYQEQSEWLIKNGFEEVWSPQNVIQFIKYLEDGRRISVWWHNGSGKFEPEWNWVLLQGTPGNSEEFYLFMGLPSNENFTKYQPLIELIK